MDDPQTARRRLADQFPTITIWYGSHTRRWWAIVLAIGRWRLIEADTPTELAMAINDPTWPWPKEGAAPTPAPTDQGDGPMPGAPRNPPKDPIDHEPEAVTYAREQAGLTKTQLANAAGVSVSLISEIEGGTRNATPAMIIKLARALNCPRVVLQRKRDTL
jgi:DNA-binding XRE family transcriptional regulator